MAAAARESNQRPASRASWRAIAIADGDGAAVRDAEEIPAVGSTITITLPAPLALSVVEHAGMEQSDDGRGWRTRDGRESPEPRVAVTDALVAIAEDDLAVEFIEREHDED